MKKRILWIGAAILLLVVITLAGVLYFTSESGRYMIAHRYMEAEKYDKAAQKFATLYNYKDSRLYGFYCAGVAAGERGNYDEAITSLKLVTGMKDENATALQEHCEMLIVYYTARQNEQQKDYEQAGKMLEKIPFFRDSAELRAAYPGMILARDYDIAESLFAQKQYNEAIRCYKTLNGYKDSKEKILLCEQARENDALEKKYMRADEMENAGLYEMAAGAFEALGDFSDSKARAAGAMNKAYQRDYDAADALEQAEKYEKAAGAFEALGDFSDSKARAVGAMNKAHQRDYDAADALEAAGNYYDAAFAFMELGDFSDSPVRAEQAKNKFLQQYYDMADAMEKAGEYIDALDLFTALENFSDAPARAQALKQPADYQRAQRAIDKGDYRKAKEYYVGLKDYKDSERRAYLCGAFQFAASMQPLNGNITVYTEDGKTGMINFATGVMIYPCWDSVKLLSNELLVLGNNKRYAVADLNGITEMGFVWDSVKLSREMVIVSANNSMGLLSATDGSEVLPCTAQQIVATASRTYLVKTENNWGMYDAKGNVIHEHTFARVEGINGSNLENAAAFLVRENKSGRYGVVAADGKVILPAAYSTVKLLENGNYLVMQNGLYGLCGAEGNVITDCQWQGISEKTYRQLYVIATNDAKRGHVYYGLMNADGKVVLPAEYLHLENAAKNFDPLKGIAFTEGRIAVCAQNGQWGFADTQGRLIAPRYDQVGTFAGGFAPVKKDGLWGFVNTDGEEVLALRYAQVIPFGSCKVNGTVAANVAGMQTTNGQWHYLLNENGVLNYFEDSRYLEAVAAQQAGEYEKALMLYDQAADYDDAARRASALRYEMAQTALEENKLDEAKALFIASGNYMDAPERVKKVTYTQAQIALAEKRYDDAITLFKACEGYADANERIKNTVYTKAQIALAEKRYDDAITLFKACVGYADANDRLYEVSYEWATDNLKSRNYEEAIRLYDRCISYKDAEQKQKEAHYKLGKLLQQQADYAGAEQHFVAAGDHIGAVQRLQTVRYERALGFEQQAEWKNAYELYLLCGAYKDAAARSQECLYQQANALLKQGSHDEAKAIYTAMADYKNSAEQAQECDYQKAAALVKKGRYGEARNLYLQLCTYKDALQLADSEAILRGMTNERYVSGSVITLGSYDQDGVKGAEPVEWIVVKQQDGKLLLVSKYGLMGHKYNDALVDTTWQTSGLRTWMNSTLYDQMFTEDEKKLILRTTVTTADSGSNKGGKATQDHMFCLSWEEAKLLSKENCICVLSEAVYKADSVWINTDYKSGWWWTRTPSTDTQQGVRVIDGDGNTEGYFAYVNKNGTVRPAIWIDAYLLTEKALKADSAPYRMYVKAVKLQQAGKYEQALVIYNTIGQQILDTRERALACEGIILENAYQAAVALQEAGKYEDAIVAYQGLNGYGDSSAKIEECENAILEREYQAAMALQAAGKYEDAIAAYQKLNGYSDSSAKIEECENAILEREYQAAMALQEAGKYEDAIVAYQGLNGYSDSNAKIEECENAILEREYQAALEREYQAAMALQEAGKYEDAIAAYQKLNGYSDSSAKIEECENAILEREYKAAMALQAAGKYQDAIVAYQGLNGYSDSNAKIQECENAILEREYKAAMALQEAGKYEDAIVAYQGLNGYSDSSAKIKECENAILEQEYQAARQLLSAKKYNEAYHAFLALKGYKDVDDLLKNNKQLAAVSAAEEHEKAIAPFKTVGNVVTYGHYEQDNNKNNGKEPIEWIVLEVQGNKVLLISKYGLDCQPYNTQYKGITWEKCTLRSWLNSTFLKAAFTAKEQKGILTTAVDNSKAQGYSGYSSNGGNDTKDKIFLLSYAEANKYFKVTWEDSNNTASRVAPTTYAIAQGARTSSSYKTSEGKDAGSWWLRSPGYDQNYAARVLTNGSLSYSSVDISFRAVRPAFWLDLESGIF